MAKDRPQKPRRPRAETPRGLRDYFGAEVRARAAMLGLADYHRLAIAASADELRGMVHAGWREKDGVRAGLDAKIATRYRVGEGVYVGARTFVDHRVVLGDGAVIGDDTLLHVADTFHLAFQPGHPDWYISFDGDPDQTVRTRRSLFARAAENGHLVMAYHAPFPGLGRIEADGDDWRWRPAE